ncbi:MAG: hypothetical protein V3U16_07215 [Candidatus Neomarinimicrobiota bacterium]
MPTYSDENIFLIWLLPSENSRVDLTSLIRQLAKIYITKPFIPHCTIARITGDSLEDKIALLVDLKEKLKPVDLKYRKIDYRKEIRKSFFLEVELTSDLLVLYQEIKNVFQFMEHDKFKPHISLIYSQHMSIREKESLKKTLTLHDNYSFDQIALVSSSANFGNWKIEYRQTMWKG